MENIQLSDVVKMVNKELLENVNDGKKYLEEVMGIVEDEEFNKQRRRKLRALTEQKPTQKIRGGKIETDPIVEDSTPCCGTKVKCSPSENIKFSESQIISVNLLSGTGCVPHVCSGGVLGLQTCRRVLLKETDTDRQGRACHQHHGHSGQDLSGANH